MSVSHAVVKGLGKFGSTRVDIYLDGTRVGVADLDPAREKFIFEPLQIPTEGQIIALAQSKNASEKEMDRMCAERDAAELKLKAAQAPENREAIRVYVGSIRPSLTVSSEIAEFRIGSQSEMPVFVPSPEPPTPPVFIAGPEPAPTLLFDDRDSVVDRNKIIMLENRADRINMVLTRIEKRLMEVEEERLDIRGIQEKLEALGTRITNLKGDYNVTAANFRIHQRRCYCNNHFPGGFTKRDETPEDTTSAHASSKP